MRTISVSLAHRYGAWLERREAESGREVVVGAVEATALGNVLVQARAAGELGSLAEMRAVAAASTEPISHDPDPDRDRAEATYRRFLDVTGLGAAATA